MYEITFFNKNNHLSGFFYDEILNEFKFLDEYSCIKCINNLSKYYNKISGIDFKENDLLFKIDGTSIILKDRKDFKHNKNFEFINKKIRSKRYKIKRTIFKAVTVGAFIGIILSTPVYESDFYGDLADVNLIPDDISTTNYVDENLENEKENDSMVLVPDDEEKETIKNVIDNENMMAIENINPGSRSDSLKLLFVKENYGDIIDKYSDMYGLDSNLICAIATQEKGFHSDKIDKGGAIGLMQVQVLVWDDFNLKVYNYDIKDYETIEITKEKLENLDFNIKTGCAIFQNCLNQTHGNVLLAIQTYNMGYGTVVKKILPKYSKASGHSIEEILDNPNDLGWLDYVTSSYPGDANYIKNVLSYYVCDYSNELDNGIKK